MSRIGFFGGCFNPPTLAHFEIVKNALKEFNLDKVIIVPMGDRYQKKDLISFEHRFNMLQKMFINDGKVEISRMQANQNEVSYAIDSFRKIDEDYKNDDRYFIMGYDNFSKIETWKESNNLVKDRKFIVFERTNPTSSSLVREKIRTKENVERLVLPEIAKYISKEGLYQ